MKLKQILILFIFAVGASYKLSATENEKILFSEEILLIDQSLDTSSFSFLSLPNAFQPNGISPLYQLFKPVYKNVEDYKISIFNRWGSLVFETTNLEEGWDGKYKGKSCPMGTYVYVMTYYPLTNGAKGDKITKRGAITLLE